MEHFRKNYITICLMCLLVGGLVSCHKRVEEEDLKNIEAFHAALTSKSVTPLAVDIDGKGGASVDLYIDYSDCMTTASSSEYYNKVQPAIIACCPNYYSIKGNAITFESNDKMKVHQLLNSISNVNYSNIKGAVDSIVNNKREAIIITDGEFFQEGIGANLNNPYLSDEFKQWLTMGLDIYVYSEPYTIANITKNRFYILFTDHRIPNNIEEIFSRNAPKDDNVKMVHLYSGVPSVKIDGEGVTFNEQLLITANGTVSIANGYECHIMDAKWDDVYDYVLNATDDNGNPLPGGDFFIKGLSINVTAEDAYRPSELEVRCYEISDLYSTFEPKNSKMTLPMPLTKMFIIDKKAWEKGNIVIKLDPEFDGESLNGELGNLLRIDICVKSSKENFTSNPEIGGKFQFNSPWGFNTSIYESLKQVLLDPAISPEKMGYPVIYSIYLSTYTK